MISSPPMSALNGEFGVGGHGIVGLGFLVRCGARI